MVTIWPEPALPKITGPGAELYGDEAYRLRGKSEDSIRTRVGLSLAFVSPMDPLPQATTNPHCARGLR